MRTNTAVWPPLISTRERLRPGELATGIARRKPEDFSAFIPVGGRSLYPTTYGKSAFELAVIDAGLADRTILMPAYISHDFVGVFKRHRITPVFADVDPHTVHLRPESIPGDLLDSVDGIVVLHAFGLPADGAGFRRVADRHGVVLIEDCARALGAARDGELVGTHGDYAAYSLSKVAPVRRGGLLLSRRPIDVELGSGTSSLAGVMNTLLLVRVPGARVLEGPLIRLLRETPAYPGEVGLYKAPRLESLEPLQRFMADSFFPHYAEALSRKRQAAVALRERLEPLGFRFQLDDGNHIHTAVGATVPPGVDRDGLRDHLRRAAINVFTLWGDPLGTSEVARELWGTDIRAFPVTRSLAESLLHFPMSRFIGERDVERMVTACRDYLDSTSRR